MCKFTYLSFALGCAGTYLGSTGKLVSDEGREIKYLAVETLQDCKDACDNTGGCRSLTYYGPIAHFGSNCFLKDKLITDETYQQTIRTGQSYSTYYCSEGNMF